VQRQGRALLLSQMIGAAVLGLTTLAPSFSVFAATLFLWGICGGVAMTMSRTIMQEQAPDAQRGRVMSFYSFSFFGAGPVGALLNGILVDRVGPQGAVVVCSVAMFSVMLIVSMTSGMWRVRAGAEPVAV
jgi:MFS family permease